MQTPIGTFVRAPWSLSPLLAAPTAFARTAPEVDLPRESPAARVFQQVGLTDIEVEYGSPAVKGRTIWGGAVPFDKPWSISPNQPTTIRFSRDVQVAGKALAAGAYRLSAVPGKAEWTLVFDRVADKQRRDGKDAKEGGDSLSVKVRAKPAAAREHLAFLFSDFDEDKATLDLEWAKVRVSIPIATNTTQQVLAGIEELDNAWRSYANAARFMLETRKDFDAGLKYADRSLAMKDDWYTHWIVARRCSPPSTTTRAPSSRASAPTISASSWATASRSRPSSRRRWRTGPSASDGRRHEVGGQAVDHRARLLARAAVRLIDLHVVARTRLPRRGEGGVLLAIELARDVEGRVQQRDLARPGDAPREQQVRDDGERDDAGA